MKRDYVYYEITDKKKLPNKIRMIIGLAKSILNDKEIDNWVFHHTATEYAYDGFFDLIRTLANFRFVEWKIEKIKRVLAIDAETGEVLVDKETTEKKGLGIVLKALKRQRGYKEFDIHNYENLIKVYCKR